MTDELFAGTKHAELYAKFRVPPPQECTDYMITFLKEKQEPPFKNAVDVGCGNGQSTQILSPHFEKVLGLDVSEAQIECAKKTYAAPNIEYKVARGEELPVESSSMQLVSFCESAHYINLKDMFTEVERVLVPNGVVSIYGHWIPLPKIKDTDKNTKVNNLINQYYCEEKLGPYWSKECDTVKNRYESIHMPFQDVHRKDFQLRTTSTLANYMRYTSTWSSYQKFVKEDEKKAEQLLLEVQDKIVAILEEDKPAENIEISVVTDYFMVIGRK